MKLTRQQLDGILTIHGQDKKYIYAKCPSCQRDEFWLLINEENHPCGCSRAKNCSFGNKNIFGLINYLGIQGKYLGERQVNVLGKAESALNQKESILQADLPEVDIPFLWKRVYEDEYLRERGFTDSDFQKYEVGRSRIKKEYVTFLVKMETKTVGYIGRSERSKAWIDAYNQKQKEIGGEQYPRYDNSSSDFSKMLFGYDEIVKGKTEDVILVEGIFSKTKTDTNLELDSSDIMKCCATFGAKISPEQIELLRIKGVKNIWLWFEADVLEKIKGISAKLSLHFNVKVSYLYDRDPNEIGQGEALELLENAKDWMNFNMSHVSSKIKNI